MIVADRKDVLLSWYAAIKDEDFEKAAEMKQAIDEEEQQNSEIERNTLYKLITARYHLMYKDLEKFSSVIAEVEPDEDNEQYWLNYYYYFFRGMYHFERGEYRSSLNFYNNARSFVFDLDINEIGEFYYRLATTYFRTYRITLSNKYIHKALKIFKDQQNYEKIADCHNIIGLNNQFIKQYHEASGHLQEALIFAERNRCKRFKNTILQNIAVLYSEQGKFKKSLKYLESIDLSSAFSNHYFRIQNLFLKAECLIVIGKENEGKELLDSLIEDCSANEIYSYLHRSLMLKSKFFNPVTFFTTYEDGISYFKKTERWLLVIEYCEELAVYLGGIHRHKDACCYFQEAIEARNKIEKERVLVND